MGRFLGLNLSSWCSRTFHLVLALLWICGLLLGILLSFSADAFHFPTMLSAMDVRLSIFSFLSALLLPLVLTAFAVYISQPCMIFPIVFMKAVLFTYVGIGLLNSFDSSGWLFRCFLMFSDSLALPILWWVWLQSFTEDRSAVFRASAVAAAGIVVICLLDSFLVTPFWTSLI